MKDKVDLNNSSSIVTSSLSRLKIHLAKASFGLVAGLIASLAISVIILLAEKVTSLPVGTFYLVLTSAILQTQGQTAIVSIEIGFLIHLLAGALIGLAISSILLFRMPERSSLSPSRALAIIKCAPVYGLVAGFVLWVGLFLPITFGIMLPLLNSHEDNNIIREHTSSGVLFTIAKDELLSIMNQVILSSLAFHLFYGLVTAILAKSMYEAYHKRKEKRLLHTDLTGVAKS